MCHTQQQSHIQETSVQRQRWVIGWGTFLRHKILLSSRALLHVCSLVSWHSGSPSCLFSLSFLILLFSSITLFTPFPLSVGFVDFYRAHGPMALSRYRMISISVLSNLPRFCKQAESPKKVGLRIKQTCFVLEKHGPAGQNAIAPVGCLHRCEAWGV